MSVPSIAGLTQAELVTLIQQANTAYAAGQATQQTDLATRKASAAAAITTLTNLLGPTNATAGTGSIRAVRQYTGAVMATNAALALPLAFQALEQLTTTMLDIATVVASDHS